MATTIEQLELEVTSSSGSAVSGIESLADSLGKLKSATKGGMGLRTVAKQLSTLNDAVNTIDGSTASKISTLAASLDKLNNLGNLKLSSTIATNISAIGKAAASITTTDFSGIERLATSLSPLSSFSASGFSSAVNALNKLPGVLTSLNNADLGAFANRLNELTASMQALGSFSATGFTSTITALNKLPKLVETLDNLDLAKFTDQIQQLSSALAPLSTQLDTIGNAFNRLPSNLRNTVSATNRLTEANGKASTSYLNLYAKAKMAIGAVRGISNTIASWITQSNQYIEDLNLFHASMGEYAEEAQKYAEQVGEIVGIDPGEFMRNQGTFNTIISGFGVASDKAYLMSKNLTQLGYDISSFYNISFENAMQKLQSGISGELEPLRRLGYDLSVARLQQEAYTLGINKSVSAMTQAEKSQLRYYAIMTQVTTAQGDMARTLDAPANQLRVLQAQVAQCARALGNIFIPTLNAVLPYAIALTKVLRMLADAVANIFGFTLPEVDYSSISAGSSAVGDLANNADDATDGLSDATAAAKKLKKALLGIDELNVLSDNEDTSSGSSAGSDLGVSGSDLGINLPTYDFLGDAITSRVDEIVEMLKAAMWEIEAAISVFALAIGTILVVSGANIPLGIGLMAIGAVGLATAITANWDGMTEQLATVLTIATGVLGGFLFVIGAILAFTGANIPLGIGLMVAGATLLATAVTINWKFLNGDLENALSILMAIASGFLLAVGVIIALTGGNIALGIALMVAGAVGLATAIGLNWDSMSEPMRKAIGILAGIVGGALIVFGAIVALTGANIPLGIGLIAAGVVSLASAVALNWGALTGDLEKSLGAITDLVSGALIGIGAVLALTGVNAPLGIAMIAAGVVGIAATADLNWNAITNKIKEVLKDIGIAAGLASLALGVILTLTNVAAPLGIALIAAGAVSLVAGVALNWGFIVNKIKEVLKEIGAVAGIAMLALGVILCLTGIGIPLGVALIAAGIGSTVASAALNWDTIQAKVKEGLDKISEKFGEFKETVGEKLDGAREKISTWAGNVKEFFTKGADGKNAIDNIRDAAGEWADSFKEGLGQKFNDANNWVKEKITTPLNEAIQNSKAAEYAVTLKNNAAELWAKAKNWWAGATKDGLSLEAGIQLVKDGWTTVVNWIGNIPIVKQGISLLKSGWETIKSWIGNIPTLSQTISLIKNGWSTVKNWIGNLPTLSQSISLLKSGWSTVANWIGNLPVISQAINLAKSGWSTVRGWIGNIPTLSQTISLVKSGWSSVTSWIGSLPTLSQGISLVRSGWYSVKNWIGSLPTIDQAIALIKSGWYSVSSWIGNNIVSVGISLFRSGWNSISSFVGTSVSVGISLFKSGWSNIKSFFGLANGGIVGANGGVNMFASGGIITPNTWKAMPKYASGTNRPHGSMFVAGESGAELVGHVNGTTEVLNRFQLASVMHSSIVSGMGQFAGYWQSMSRDLVTCANGIINAVVVSTAGIDDNLALASASGYDPYTTLAQSVYEDTKKSYEGAYTDDSWSRNMREFYHEYVEPTLKEIATDTKRQADKTEQTIIQVGNRTINDAVTTQKQANGFSFTE